MNSPREKLHIAYIDDDEDDYFLFKTFVRKLRSYDYVLHYASSFEDGITLAQTKPIDIFIVDYVLGPRSGMDLLEPIRKIIPFAPFILLTGMAGQEIEELALEKEASDYLVKGGFTVETLERSIRYAFRNYRNRKALDETTKNLKNLFDKTSEAILLINKKGKLVDANPAYLEKFGKPKNPEGNIALELLANKRDLDQIIQTYKSKNEIDNLEILLLDKHQKPIPVLLSINALSSDYTLYQVNIVDITDLKLRNELAFYQRQFEASGRMARILGHEVKNPLTNILLSVDQLKDELTEDVLEESGDLLEVVERNAKRINELITQLLNSTRYSELNRSHTTAQLLAEETIELAEDRILLNHIQLRKKFPEHDVHLFVDTEKVKIVLLNLVLNAVEAMRGEIRHLDIIIFADDNTCTFQVTDTGAGMDADVIAKLFEPFFTSKKGGSGLGLTNSQKIVMQHGGNINVKSTPGIGSTFFVSFDVHKGFTE